MIEVVDALVKGTVFELLAEPAPDQSRDRGRVLPNGLGDFRGANPVSRGSQGCELNSCLNLLPPVKCGPKVPSCVLRVKLEQMDKGVHIEADPIVFQRAVVEGS